MEHSSCGGRHKAYPFRTRRQIATQIQSDREFARECLEIMVGRHVSKESTAAEGAMGWGSSDASRIAGPVQRIVDGLDTDGDWEELLPVLARYTKQLAQHFRERQLEANPALAEVAALYGVSAAGVMPITLAQDEPPPCAGETSPVATMAVALPVAPEPLVDAVTSDAVPRAQHVSRVECAPLESVTVKPPTTVEVVTSEITRHITPVEKAITAYLTRHERGTTTEIAERTRRDRGTVLEALRQMHAQGTIVRAGTGRGTFYSLPKSNTSSVGSAPELG